MLDCPSDPDAAVPGRHADHYTNGIDRGASIASAQTIKFDKPFQCNGERLIITGCFDDSNSSNCTVVYPDRPKTGGVEQMKIELRGDVIKRIKTCVGPGATLASVTAALGHSAPSPATATPAPAPSTTLSSIFNSFMESYFGWMLLALVGYGVYRAFFKKVKAKDPADSSGAKSNKAALEAFGPTQQARTERIDQVFDRRQDTIYFEYDDIFAKAKLGRSLTVMPIREVEALRVAYHLHNLGITSMANFFNSRFGLIWADGKAVKYGDTSSHWDEYMRPFFTSTEQAVGLAIQDLNGAVQKNPTQPVLSKLQSRLMGGSGIDLPPTLPLKCTENGNLIGDGLILGLDTTERKKRWYYDGEGHLITVAPTRSGKTASHVYPNVLNWKGPMIVLDIKGEIYAKTSKWRKENVGPVYRFSPLDDKGTNCYNPLTAVRSDALHLWSDAGVLADLMIVPPEDGSGGGGNSKFFDDAARDLIQAAIAYVCLERDPAKRPMSKVLDIVHGIDWDQFVSYLQSCVDMPSLARAGKALAQPIPAETRATILRTAQGKLSAWMGDLVERATAKSDWQPSDFRSGSNPSLYICVSYGELKSISSVLRTIIGQHINLLTNGQPPARTNPPASPILFVLDEMPQLRYMPPIESALVVGAGYGVKLWMFVQNVGQLKKEYEDAEGMMGNCAVRMYMNVSLVDGMAQKLSDDIGFRDSIADGSRVKIFEPNVLAGEEFKDKVIVWASGMARPASLQKNFAHLDENLTARMGSL